MAEKTFRFREIKLRVFNKETKKMIYSNEEKIAFAINASGFSVLKLDDDGNVLEVLGDETNSVLMQGAGVRDEKSNDIYEGDVLFFSRQTIKGRLPVVGVVNAQDFTFCVNSSLVRHTFEYSDKNIFVLGNIFETSDEDLAKSAQEKLDQYTPESLKKKEETKEIKA